jgi:protein-S-isoprenylcysteine O-methyltransferase Ste14
MQALELKVPPPVVMLLLAVGMYFASDAAPAMQYQFALRLPFGLLLGLAGLAVNVAGLVVFRRHRTTVNPLQPGRATELVCDGIFRLTRNPMYLGMVMMLVGWALYLANGVALFGPVALVAWLTRFQILPEERALRHKFPGAFEDYARRVRRWL